jgi:hypothetical protein
MEVVPFPKDSQRLTRKEDGLSSYFINLSGVDCTTTKRYYQIAK